MVNHFRDSKAGRFYLERDHLRPPPPSDIPAFLRFAKSPGQRIGLDLWAGEGAPADGLLASIGMHWPVHEREVLAPTGHQERQPTPVRGYRALVRPDTEHVMSVVTTGYSPADNLWVADTLQRFASRLGNTEPIIAAASFGRDNERTLFASRVTATRDDALCLLAYNSHGGEGAIKFQLVEVDRLQQATYVLDSPHATRTFAHVGDIEETLQRASNPTLNETFIEKYLSETRPLWDGLNRALWTPRHTAALIDELWGTTPPSTTTLPNGHETTLEEASRHPGHHLPHRMSDISDAANAYRAICDWIDNHSEACERGDFTSDRDERLALGAGNKYKRNAWRWITANT